MKCEHDERYIDRLEDRVLELRAKVDELEARNAKLERISSVAITTQEILQDMFNYGRVKGLGFMVQAAGLLSNDLDTVLKAAREP